MQCNLIDICFAIQNHKLLKNKTLDNKKNKKDALWTGRFDMIILTIWPFILQSNPSMVFNFVILDYKKREGCYLF